MICIGQKRRESEDSTNYTESPNLGPRDVQVEESKQSNEEDSDSTLNSSIHLSQTSNSSKQKLSEEFFQMLIVEEIPMSENIKVYNENDWINIINGKSKKYTSRLELRASLRAGIPRRLRPKIWLWLTEQKKLEKQHGENLFEKLSKTESKCDKDIKMDVDRTNVSSLQKDQITKILRAYANYDPEIGYTQGMNYVVSGILNSLEIMHTEQKKKNSYVSNKAFWIFVYICFQLNWRQVYKSKMQKAIQMLKNLETQISKILPDIHEHMKQNGVEVTLCFCESFVTILMQQGPVSLQKRILDMFLLEGEKILYQIIIRFLQLTKRQILERNTMEDVVQFLKRDLITYCFENYKTELSKLFPLPQTEIVSQKVSVLGSRRPTLHKYPSEVQDSSY